MDSPIIVGIRFTKVGKVYHFDATRLPGLQPGDHVIVETSRGWQLGQVAQLVSSPLLFQEGPLKPVDRRATPRDLVMRQVWQAWRPLAWARAAREPRVWRT